MSFRFYKSTLLVGISAFVVAALAGCSTLVPPPKGTGSKPKDKEESGLPKAAEAKNLTVRWNERGAGNQAVRMMEVHAVRGNLSAETESGRLFTADGLLYKDDVARAKFEAPVVDALKDHDTVVASRGATLTSLEPAGMKLTADHMVWIASKHLVVAEGGVRFENASPERPDEKVTGGPFDRMIVNTELQEMTIPDMKVKKKTWLDKRLASALAMIAATGGIAIGQQAPAAAPPEKSKLVFRNAELSKYDSLKFKDGLTWTAVGKETLLESTDDKTGYQSWLRSPKITVFIKPKSQNEVDKATADGPVRFEQKSQVLGDKGVQLGEQVMKFTGSFLEMKRSEKKVVLRGPVTFDGTQPSGDGKVKHGIRGTASLAEYDEDKRILTLHHVKAEISMPDRFNGPSPFAGDHVTIDLSKSPLELDVDNDSPDSGSLKVKPKIEEKKDEKKDDKKDGGKVIKPNTSAKRPSTEVRG